MAEWTAEELLYFDIAHALRKVKIPAFVKPSPKSSEWRLLGPSLNTSKQRHASSATLLSHGSMVMNRVG
jgi:hypothetical protein